MPYRNPEEARARQRAYYVAHRDRFLANARRNVTGWTAERYEEMLLAQEGRCAVCGAPDGRRLRADHRGVQQRGLLCHHCNSGLGLFRDSADLLRLAAEYLDSYREGRQNAS